MYMFSVTTYGITPAVSWLKPDDSTDGYPRTSMPFIFEAVTKKAVEANSAASTTPSVLFTH